jgi:hypothetical protein
MQAQIEVHQYVFSGKRMCVNINQNIMCFYKCNRLQRNYLGMCLILKTNELYFTDLQVTYDYFMRVALTTCYMIIHYTIICIGIYINDNV